MRCKFFISKMEFPKVISGFGKYPKSADNMEYGTAGFRAKASLLDPVAFRVGVLSCLRAKATKRTIGLMITASHNPADDNGVKLIDPMGEMLESSWEKIATNIVNSDSTSVETLLNTVIVSNNIDISAAGCVVIGWDTRPSSSTLVEIAAEGISSLNGNPYKFELCTTPLLHYMVRCTNDNSYGDPSSEGYYTKILTAFDKLWISNNSSRHYTKEVNFDGANGVGTFSMKYVQNSIKDKLKINIFNGEINALEKLNFKCGADYVKQLQDFPLNFPNESYKRNVSFDGDADRIIYFYSDDTKKFHILDGDKMAVLIATFLKELVNNTPLTPSFGIIQTAYANGSSTKYITEKLDIEAPCVKTGVKFLHPKALEYDIGIYFEANGHGTVVFSSNLKKQINDTIANANGNQLDSLLKLKNFIDMVNETIGDAFTDFLIIETILHCKDWNLEDWEKLYEDLPNKQLKVSVKDRNVITTSNAEKTCLTPLTLQEGIDKLAESYTAGRSFVRPSGTEDIVRIYAEAATQLEANEFATKVAQLVYDLADGLGERPT